MGDTWELINHPMSDETGLELAAQMKRQNDILAGIAAGTAGAEFVDATFRGLLDGKNTTEIFWSWWPLSAGWRDEVSASGTLCENARRERSQQNLHRSLLQ